MTGGPNEDISDVAARFIRIFNEDDWDSIGDVVSPEFTLHHPMGGDLRLGPEGMVKVWSTFKAALPDSWHPIPIMISEGPWLANLLPTYGTFNGTAHQGIPPTGRWLEYGMVNVVRIEGGKLVEAWFGMDPLVEMAQMGAVPPLPKRQLAPEEEDRLERFHQTVNAEGRDYDNVTAFRDVVVAMGPPQHGEDTRTRRLEVYRYSGGALALEHSHEFPTVPSYAGDPAVDTGASKALVESYLERVVNGHDLDALEELVSPHVLVHSTGMPCEASYYGLIGIRGRMQGQWASFPDLRLVDHFTLGSGDIVAMRWTAQGTSEGMFMGLQPTGGPVTWTGTSMFRIEDGRIAEIWETRNTLAIMMQLDPQLGKGEHQP